jgi:hypothetical protein
MCIRFLAALTALVTPAALAAPCDASFPGRNGRLGAVRVDDPGCRDPGPTEGSQCDIQRSLLTVGADGRGRRTLIRCYENGFLAGPPAYSPDGTRIAYMAGGHLVVTTADGRDPRPLARPLDWCRAARNDLLGAPVWSPDGTRIAFVESESIAVIPSRGGAARTMLAPPVSFPGLCSDFSPPSWQPLR